jgi:hypothetical protein
MVVIGYLPEVPAITARRAANARSALYESRTRWEDCREIER